MKITQKVLLLVVPVMTFVAPAGEAQEMREMQALEVIDYECLRSLDCAQSSQSLKAKGWAFIYDDTVDENAGKLTARMVGENVYFFAIYDEQGKVVKSTYQRDGIALPRSLLSYFTQSRYKGWQITGTEMVMTNFDPNSKIYRVTIQNKSSVKSIIIDTEFIKQLHEKGKGLARNGL